MTEVVQAAQGIRGHRPDRRADPDRDHPRVGGRPNDRFTLFQRGEANVITYLEAQRIYNDNVKAYHDTAVRHRRSMLGLNTALGQRILP